MIGGHSECLTLIGQDKTGSGLINSLGVLTDLIMAQVMFGMAMKCLTCPNHSLIRFFPFFTYYSMCQKSVTYVRVHFGLVEGCERISEWHR